MKKLSFFLMAMLVSLTSFAETYTHTFKSGELKVGSVTLSSVAWTGAGTVEYWGWDSNNGRGIQIGSGNKPCTSYSLTTSAFAGTITEVVVNTSIGSSGTAKLSVSVGGTSYLANKSLTTTATNYTATGAASGDLVISYTNTAKAFYIKSISVTYELGEEDPDATKYTVTTNVNDGTMGIVTGAGEYAEGTTVTLTAAANPGYKFVNWSNGETANPLKLTVTENVEITANFEAIPPMTCAEASAAAKDEVVVLNPFDVVYVVKDAGYIYIKDESGVNLIYDFNLDDKLKAGDHVEGFVGVSSPYNGLPEIKPSVTFEDLTVTPGTTTAPTVMATAPTAADVNKYIKLEKVTFSSDATFATSSATNATMVVNGTNVTLRNQFKLSKSFVKNGVYDITGFAAVYNSTVQIYYLSAAKLSLTISATANGGTVTGTGEFMEGDEVTLTATADEGYEFVNWTKGEEVVATEAEYTFTVTENVTLVANFKEVVQEPVEPEYAVYEQAITNLVIDFDNLILTGGPSEEFLVTVTLGLGEYDMTEGIFQLLPESEISVQGYAATFVEGWAYVDGIANTAEAVVRCLWNDMAIEFHLSMSAAPLEATVVVVENAAVEIEKVLLFGDMYDYALKMTGIWTNEGVDYPVLVEVPVYYPEATEPSEITSTVTVGGWEDDDPWLGFGEGTLTITTIDGVVTATGVVTNQGAGIAIDITISGTLPQGPTGVENNTINVKAMKVIRDGQLIIRNNGVEFNAQGAIVK